MRIVEGQYVAYTFFRVDPAWRRESHLERPDHKERFAEVVDSFAERFDHLRAYTVTGVRPDCDFFLWKITERYELLEELGAALNGTELAGWLETPYSYLATTKASQYTSARKARKITPHGLPYLVVYPFVKTRPWYALPAEERYRVMQNHIRIGRQYPQVDNHTTYSFGLDDQEFVVAFDTDDVGAFLDLVQELRGTEASAYTLRDTPSFTCLRVSLERALSALDGEPIPALAGLG